ncbi:MAG: 8-amino-7-oxononanoate synthase [Thermodesulfobacteriota bacterium]
MEDYAAWLNGLRATGSHRSLRPLVHLEGGRVRPAGEPAGSEPLYDFSSNDYLALTRHPKLLEYARACLLAHGSGAGAARLMSGDLEMHHRLEAAIARLKRQEAALLFGSGYLANVGIIPALAGRGRFIYTDRLNHASIYDGCRLAEAKLVRFRHNDPGHLEEQLRRHGGGLIVVETVYSMDGDLAPLAEIIALKKRYGCLLMVDEAHATGIFGDNGGGLASDPAVAADVDLAMGTFSKALGSYGAYVAGSRTIIDALINRARSFIFSTALPPAVIGASQAALEVMEEEPELRLQLLGKCALFQRTLTAAGLAVDSPSPIVPLIIGDNDTTLALADELRRRGVWATAVRPPTVPAGTARLRFTVTRHLADELLADKARLIAACVLGRRQRRQ